MLEGTDPEGATPLGPDELSGLKPSWVATRQDLNEAEQANVLKALGWTASMRQRDLLSEKFILELHRRMFSDVWKWAGTLRQRETNIGVGTSRIRPACRELLDDVRYWIEHQSYERDEIAVRLHHRLVQIHPFPNGNGRHTRLMADLLIGRLGAQPFTWGRSDLTLGGAARRSYIAALKAADSAEIAPLLAFARS